jgi:hypothetical protein
MDIFATNVSRPAKDALSNRLGPRRDRSIHCMTAKSKTACCKGHRGLEITVEI